MVASNSTNLLSYCPEGQKYEMGLGRSQGVGRTVFPLEAVGKNLSPCVVQLLEVAHTP